MDLGSVSKSKIRIDPLSKRKKLMDDFKPTSTEVFVLGKDVLRVLIEDTPKRYAFQLEVNGSKSDPSSHYRGILVHQGWAYASPYWEGTLPVGIPFKITPAIKER